MQSNSFPAFPICLFELHDMLGWLSIAVSVAINLVKCENCKMQRELASGSRLPKTAYSV